MQRPARNQGRHKRPARQQGRNTPRKPPGATATVLLIRTASESDFPRLAARCAERLCLSDAIINIPGGYAAIQIQFSKTKVNFIDHNQTTHVSHSLEGHFSRIDTLFTKRTKRTNRTNRSFLSVLARGKSLSYTRAKRSV